MKKTRKVDKSSFFLTFLFFAKNCLKRKRLQTAQFAALHASLLAKWDNVQTHTIYPTSLSWLVKAMPELKTILQTGSSRGSILTSTRNLFESFGTLESTTTSKTFWNNWMHQLWRRAWERCSLGWTVLFTTDLRAEKASSRAILEDRIDDRPPLDAALFSFSV